MSDPDLIIEARYPGDWPEAMQADAERAGIQARAVYESVTAELARRGVHTGET